MFVFVSEVAAYMYHLSSTLKGFLYRQGVYFFVVLFPTYQISIFVELGWSQFECIHKW